MRQQSPDVGYPLPRVLRRTRRRAGTPERKYFTLPTFVQQGYSDELEKAVDLSRHPFLGQFPAWCQRNSVNGNRKFVLLSKDRHLPFVTLTKGEYPDAIGVALTRFYDAEKKRIAEAEQGDPQRIAQWMKPHEEKFARPGPSSRPTARSTRHGSRRSPRSGR